MGGFPGGGGATAPLTLTSPAAATTPLALVAAPGQSGDMLDIFASNGTTKLASFDSAADFTIPAPATASFNVVNVINHLRDNAATFSVSTTTAHTLQLVSAALQLSSVGGAAAGLLSSGAGAPGIAGSLGDMFFRTDTPGTANQRIYICTTAGAAGVAVWTGIV